MQCNFANEQFPTTVNSNSFIKNYVPNFWSLPYIGFLLLDVTYLLTVENVLAWFLARLQDLLPLLYNLIQHFIPPPL